MTTFHPFHMVAMSPWPLMGGLSAMFATLGFMMYFSYKFMNLFIMSLILTTLIAFQWWRDIGSESVYEGCHTLKVVVGLKLGMILFIISEVMLFFSFFWAFFYSSMAPTIQISLKWPPTPISPFNPYDIPLLNTLILLSSGVSGTWCHYQVKAGNKKGSLIALIMTISLGLYFTSLQLWEYSQASFSIFDSVYGSLFFMSTGFHGFHVIVGTTFLIICLFRLKMDHFSKTHHFGLEAALWYWHFVDVVWLFLYTFVYFHKI